MKYIVVFSGKEDSGFCHANFVESLEDIYKLVAEYQKYVGAEPTETGESCIYYKLGRRTFVIMWSKIQ